MKEQFTDSLRLSQPNVVRLQTVNDIIAEYLDEGYTLTLRQLYYQLVSRDIVPNKQAEYSKLSGLLVKGRMAGVVDWQAIEDRIRVPYLPYWVGGVEDALSDTIGHYRLNRQKDQEVYLELWVEKDALSGVLRPLTTHYHIRLMVNRGYSSCTAMYDAYNRLKRYEMNNVKPIILYLGDHDPSGLDMIRDIDNRLNEFGVNAEVVHIGLTQEQIKQYNPPPNPAKITDPRSTDYIERFGNKSWEVDALTPQMLRSLIETNIEERIDMKKFEDIVALEEKHKAKLKLIANNFSL